ncbi:MAG: hypothetical protein PWP24_1209 [Clostridiales bacterium]|nr:hypothetical protein [Clostridiales bacterium]
MKYNCDIIKDLLPLYQDEACSEASKSMVAEHLEECDACKQIAVQLKNTNYETLFQEESQQIIREHAKKEQNYSFLVGASIAGVLMVPLIVSLVCNLIFGHTLDWFFLVLTSLMVFASLTVVPFLSKEKRLLNTVTATTISTLFLLLTCCIYTGGDWFFVAALPILLGVSVLFAPVYLMQYGRGSFVTTQKGLLSMALDTVLVYAVVLISLFYANSRDAFYQAIEITTIGVSFAWLLFLVIRYVKGSILLKVGLCSIFSGIFISVINPLISYILGEPAQASDQVNAVIGITIAAMGLLVAFVGLVRTLTTRSQ